jgi:hypothetical protein
MIHWLRYWMPVTTKKGERRDMRELLGRYEMKVD